MNKSCFVVVASALLAFGFIAAETELTRSGGPCRR